MVPLEGTEVLFQIILSIATVTKGNTDMSLRKSSTICLFSSFGTAVIPKHKYCFLYQVWIKSCQSEFHRVKTLSQTLDLWSLNKWNLKTTVMSLGWNLRSSADKQPGKVVGVFFIILAGREFPSSDMGAVTSSGGGWIKATCCKWVLTAAEPRGWPCSKDKEQKITSQDEIWDNRGKMREQTVEPPPSLREDYMNFVDDLHQYLITTVWPSPQLSAD